MPVSSLGGFLWRKAGPVITISQVFQISKNDDSKQGSHFWVQGKLKAPIWQASSSQLLHNVFFTVCFISAANTWISGLLSVIHKKLIPNNNGHGETIFQEMSESSLLDLMKAKFWRVKVQLLCETLQVALLQWPEQVGAGRPPASLFAQWLIHL